MTRRTLAIPALTPELRFALKHWQEMEQLSEGKKSDYKEVRKQVDQIIKRAGVDAKLRIMRTAECIASEVSATTRVSWTDRSVENDWGTWGPFRKPHGKSDWPGWEGPDACVVYHAETLTSRSTLSEMATRASKAAREFPGIAMPYLHKLGTG